MQVQKANIPLTGLTAQFVQNVWIESYDPTIEDSYRKTIEVDVCWTLIFVKSCAGSQLVGQTSRLGDPRHSWHRAIQ